MLGGEIPLEVEGGPTVSRAVLITHVSPPIHGQSAMASQFVEQAERFSRVRLFVVNAVYSADRESLVTFNIRKALLTLRYLGSALATVRRTRAHLVVVTPSFHTGPFLKDAFVICAVKWLTRARVLAWVHMDPSRLELERKPWWYRRVARIALAQVDDWVACAPSLPGRWPAFVPRSRTHVVSHGIPGVPEGMSVTERTNGALRVCFLSSLDSSKGWTMLLDVADEICAASTGVEFHFYGDAGIDLPLEAVARRFHACRFPDRIVWHGPVHGRDKWTSLMSANLFCLPSATEQLPIVILEAMASGLAIVATRVGALGDAVVEGQGGWLVAPGSSDELRRALEDAIEDRGRLDDFGRFNAERQRREFSSERFGADWEQLLAELTTEPTG